MLSSIQENENAVAKHRSSVNRDRRGVVAGQWLHPNGLEYQGNLERGRCGWRWDLVVEGSGIMGERDQLSVHALIRAGQVLADREET